MQLGLIITLVLVGSLLHDRSCFAHDCGQSEKLRPKPREIRGFKPDHMSTAYGFGKREVSKQNRFDKLMMLMQHFPRRFVNFFLVDTFLQFSDFLPNHFECLFLFYFFKLI